MATLHTVNKSPFDRNTLDACLRLAQPGSAVLLIEDGVYGALAGTQSSAKVEAASKDIRFYVLEPDLKARGLGEANLVDGITAVDYEGFVDLTVEFSPVNAWL